MTYTAFRIYIIFVAVAVVVSGGVPQTASAVSNDDVFTQILEPQQSTASAGTLYLRGFVYPIPELGDCSGQQSCFDYCEQMANISVCASFSERHGLMPPGAARTVQSLVSALLSGNRPGPCNTLNDCVSYCDLPGSRDDCIDFARKIALNSSVLGISDSSSSPSSVVQLPRGLLNYCDTAQSCGAYCATSAKNPDCALLPYRDPTISAGSYITPDIQKLIADSNNYVAGNYAATTTPKVKARSSFEIEQIGQQLRSCLDNAQSSIIVTPPPSNAPAGTFPQENLTLYQQQNDQCVQQSNQQLPTIEENQQAKRVEAINDATSIQDCLANVKNFALEYKRCLSQ